MTETPRPYDGQPVRTVPQDDAAQRRKALETLRRSLKSAVKQVEELLALDDRRQDHAA